MFTSHFNQQNIFTPSDIFGTIARSPRRRCRRSFGAFRVDLLKYMIMNAVFIATLVIVGTMAYHAMGLPFNTSKAEPRDFWDQQSFCRAGFCDKENDDCYPCVCTTSLQDGFRYCIYID
uniref:Putative membrane protein n=1 Tax=Ixodes ricinus TaxID=34613 RepID=A0A6B0UN38_IXORI